MHLQIHSRMLGSDSPEDEDNLETGEISEYLQWLNHQALRQDASFWRLFERTTAFQPGRGKKQRDPAPAELCRAPDRGGTDMKKLLAALLLTAGLVSPALDRGFFAASAVEKPSAPGKPPKTGVRLQSALIKPL